LPKEVWLRTCKAAQEKDGKDGNQRRQKMGEFVKVANTGDLKPGSAKFVEVGDKQIALFNIDGDYYAIDDVCTHSGGSLSEGWIVEDEVTCPLHGAIYNIKTGEVTGPPAPRGVAKYNVRVRGTDVEVEV
jgi:3-phenylpropionate/trans-cinnamate dioxygenase ferredoxin subunit